MVKLKKTSVHIATCPTCRGNGYLRVTNQTNPTEEAIHQCWDCDSEGEFYVHESKDNQDNNDSDNSTIDKFLH